nr:retrovirus-related Pol polyprotein from transposon TNT 1-94 [Tanacetum cinerariifolium]
MNIAIRVAHTTNVSRPQLRSNQMTDKVMPNNSHVKAKKTEVEDHHRISSISNKTKSVTAYLEVALRKSTCFVRDLQENDLLIGNRGSDLYTISIQELNTSTPICLIAKALPTQAWLWHRRLSHLNFDYINLLSKKDVVIGLPKLKYVKDQLCSSCVVSKAKRSSFRTKENDLLTGNRGSDLYTISIQELNTSTPICLMAKALPTQAWLWHRRLSHLNFDYINLVSKKDVVIGLPKLKYVKDQLCSSCVMSKAKRSSFRTKAVPSSKRRLNLLHMDLCGPMRVASINGKNTF